MISKSTSSFEIRIDLYNDKQLVIPRFGWTNNYGEDYCLVKPYISDGYNKEEICEFNIRELEKVRDLLTTYINFYKDDDVNY